MLTPKMIGREKSSQHCEVNRPGVAYLTKDSWFRRHAALGRQVYFVYVSIVVLIGMAAGFVLWTTRESALQESQRGGTNLAVALAEQTERYVQTVDQTMAEVKSLLTEADRSNQASFKTRIQSPEMHKRLTDRQANLLEAHAIILVSADGEVLSTSRPGIAPDVNIADRGYFEYLRDHDDPNMVVGSPAVSRTTGKPSLYLARRVNSPDGRFLGLIVSVVNAAYLTDFYRSIGDRLGGAVTLLSHDGMVLLRYPAPAGLVGQRVPATSGWYSQVAKGGGSYGSPGLLDGVASIVDVQPLGDYPLVVDVATPLSGILASWRRQAMFVGAGALATAVGFVLLTWALMGQFERQRLQNVRLNQTANSLARSDRKSRVFAEMSADWFWEQNADLRFSADAGIPLTSLPSDVGRTRWELGDPAMDQHRWESHKADLTARRPFRDFRWERIQTNGKRRYMSTSGDPIFDEASIFLGYEGTGRDVTVEVESAVQLSGAKDRAEQAEALLSDAVDSMSESFVIYDRDDCFVMCNEGYRKTHRKIYGEGANRLVSGMHLKDILEHAVVNGGGGEAARGREAEWVAERLRYHRQARGAFEQRVGDGSWYLVTNRRMNNGGVAGLRIDITERKRSEERVLYMAHHDALTGLPNRTLLNDRLTQALSGAERTGGTIALLALDLNRFKAINDGFGHEAGDRLLKMATARLTAIIRSSDTLARVGGDEFVAVLPDVDPLAAGEFGQKFIDSLSEPFLINDLHMRIGASVGIALYPADGLGAETLFKNADTALYRAKTDQKNSLCFFEPGMGSQLFERWTLEQELRQAIGTDQLRVHYQPTFATATRSIVGFEALLRWRHPVRGEIPPMSFISIAEETGLILTIGAWVMEEACRTASSWSKRRRIAVNLSAAQLLSGNLPAQVADILRRTELPAHLLELEVTETMLISNHDFVLRTLNELRDMGVQIACDDFGTGYCSFGYIQNLAFDRLKIDQSFVRQLGVNPTAPRIIRAILAMARSLGMEVTAEGVETEQQFSMLKKLGCAEIQGFLLGRSMPPDAIAGASRSAITV